MPDFSVNPHSLAYLEEGQFISGFQMAVTRSEQFFYVKPLSNRVKEYAGALKELAGNQTNIVEVRSMAKQLRTELQTFKANVFAAANAVETESNGFIRQTNSMANIMHHIERIQIVKSYLTDVTKCVTAFTHLLDAIAECKVFRSEFNKLMLTVDVLDPNNQDEVGTFTYNARSLIAPSKQVKDIVADLFVIEKELLPPLKRLAIYKDFQCQLRFLADTIYQDILMDSINIWLSEIRKSSPLFGCKLMVLADQLVASTNLTFSNALQDLHGSNNRGTSKDAATRGASIQYTTGSEGSTKCDDVSSETRKLLATLSTLSRILRNECYYDYVNEVLAISELLGFKERAIAHIASVRQKQEPVTEAFDYTHYMDYLECGKEGPKGYERVYSYLGYFFATEILITVVPSLSNSVGEHSASRFAALLCRLCDDYCRNPRTAFLLEFQRIIICLRFFNNFPKVNDVVNHFVETCLKVHAKDQALKYQDSIVDLIQCNARRPDCLLSLKQDVFDDLLLALKGQIKEIATDTIARLQQYIYYEGMQRAIELAVLILRFTLDVMLFFYPSCSILKQYQNDRDRILSLITFVCTKEPSSSVLAAMRCTQEQIDISLLLDTVFSFLLVHVHPLLITALNDVTRADILIIIQAVYMFKSFDIALRLVSKVIFVLFGSQELCNPFRGIVDPLYSSMFSSLSYVLPDLIVRSMRLFAATNQPIDFIMPESVDIAKILPGTLSIALITNYSGNFVSESPLPIKLNMSRFLNYFVSALRFLPTEFISQLIKIANILLVDSYLQTVSRSTVLRIPAAGGLKALCTDLNALQEIPVTISVCYELTCRNTSEGLSALYRFEEKESMQPPGQRMVMGLINHIADEALAYGGFKIESENEAVVDKLNVSIADLSKSLHVIESNDRTIMLLNAFQPDNANSLQALQTKCYSVLNDASIDSGRLAQKEALLVRMLTLSNEGFRKMQSEFLEATTSTSQQRNLSGKSSLASATSSVSPENTISPPVGMSGAQTPDAVQLNAKIKAQFMSIFAPKRGGKKQDSGTAKT